MAKETKPLYRMSEAEIQDSICEWLRFKGIYAWRNNSTGVYDKASGGYRAPSRYQVNGVADILAILPDGRLLAVEVKRNDKAKVSEAQIKFSKNINNFGGLAFVAWSVGQVAERLEKEGYIK